MRVENIGFGNLKLKQNPEEFCYGIDAVILADFASGICGNFKAAADLGTGSGVIPFILSHKGENKSSRIVGIDIQQSCIDMARESCRMNGLTERVRFLRMDVAHIAEGKSASELFEAGRTKEESRGFFENLSWGSFDVVTANPPYVARGSGIANGNMNRFISRQETTAGMEEFAGASARLLKRGGHFFLVHRPSRLADIMYYCRKCSLEPKTLRFVSPRRDEAPNIVLLHCVKGGGKELHVLRNLFVYEENGDYSEEINRIYER